MFCRYCGRQVPDDSAFCQHCGKQLSLLESDATPSQGWEYLTLVLNLRRGEAGWVAQESYPAPLAQQHFWNDAMPFTSDVETMMADNGWQPVGEHGPACVELGAYKSAEGFNPLALALGTIATCGVNLLFARTWKFTVKSITLRWRRPTAEEGISEQEIHMWFDKATGELEPWEFDEATGQWVPMDVDELLNRIERQQLLGERQRLTPSSSPTAVPEPVSSPAEGIHPPTAPSLSPIRLTDEEGRIIRLLADGLSNPEIAERLGKSPVHTSLVTTDLLGRFEAETKDELVRMAREKGLLPPK